MAAKEVKFGADARARKVRKRGESGARDRAEIMLLRTPLSWCSTQTMASSGLVMQITKALGE